MGKLFLMSMRFDKQSPADFGLVAYENSDIFFRQTDHSLWKSRALYDYGCGKENGYYKIPMPDFNELVNIILHSKTDDDKYGAAAVILDDFCDELLNKCFEIFAYEHPSENILSFSQFFSCKIQ